ncbi:MAG: hypothetical protein ACXABD_10590 [Candidatus Thorarchaeota archaeon]|jgi:hypothetical protein
MAVDAVPGFDLQPSSEQVLLQTNYITNFDFLNQYLPDTYEKEFERYGNRTVASFLRMVGAEMPSNSDLIKWAEQGRLHTKYTDVESGAAAGAATATLTINDVLVPGTGSIAIRVGQTIMLSDSSIASTNSNKALVTGVDTANGQIDVAYYEAAGQSMAAGVTCSLFIYGSEFQKGAIGMQGQLEADDFIFENSPIIIKDHYAVSGSDMAQIGWIEVTTENGATGFLWYLKSEHETVIEDRGNVWSGGNPTALADFDAIIQRLDKQGSIEENVLFVNREFGFDIDDMLAAQNSYGNPGGTSYGLFDNDEEMALNLGFSGFRRGYDFYKTDWKYLNDPTMRGDIVGGAINGVLVPAGSTTVYDQVLGKNAKRPFLHVRYRASETEDRRYKTWITGSAGGAATSDLDAMEVNFLSERALCTLGANNFFIFTN